jgi:hypothetical protein
LAKPKIGNGHTAIPGQQGQDIIGDPALDGSVSAQTRGTNAQNFNGNGRVGLQTLLPKFGSGQAQIRVGRLQPFVIQQRHLNGYVGAERFAVGQGMHAHCVGLGFGRILDPDRFFANRGTGGFTHGGKSSPSVGKGRDLIGICAAASNNNPPTRRILAIAISLSSRLPGLARHSNHATGRG